jgi:ABC-type transport system involved in cytochrome c biogenesis permease component
MVHSVIEPSLYRPNVSIFTPHVSQLLTVVAGITLIAAASIFIVKLLIVWLDRSWQKDSRNMRLMACGAPLAAVVAGTLAAHWIVFRTAGILTVQRSISPRWQPY